MSEAEPSSPRVRKHIARKDVVAHLVNPASDPQATAQAMGITLAELAMRANRADARAALDALHALFSASADLGVARTRAEAARQLERLVRDAASLEASPDQIRRLLIDVLKLAERRPKRAERDGGAGIPPKDEARPLSPNDQVALRDALGAIALRAQVSGDQAEGGDAGGAL